MWNLLDVAVKKVEEKSETDQEAIVKTIRRFLKDIVLNCTWRMKNLELHKRYNFLSYLIKEINVGGGGNNFDIADKITVSEFRQEQTGEHKKPEIEAQPEVKKSRSRNPPGCRRRTEKRLFQIIDEVNALSTIRRACQTSQQSLPSADKRPVPAESRI